MSIRLFISYRVLDKPLAENLEDGIKRFGYKVWRDVNDIPKGIYWTDEVDSGLESSNIVLACITPEALLSRNVRNEWIWAKNNGKEIIFVVWEKIEWIPTDFADTPVIDFTDVYTIERDKTTKEIIDFKIKENIEEKLFELLNKAILGDRNITSKLTYEAEKFQDKDVIEYYEKQNPIKFPPNWKHLLQLSQTVSSYISQTRSAIDVYVSTPYQIEGKPSLDFSKPILQEVTNVFNKADGRLAITGPLGSGKTTILQSLAHSLLLIARDNPIAPVPVWLSVRHFDINTTTLDILPEIIGNVYNIDSTMISDWLNQGTLCIVIDGIDEINNYKYVREFVMGCIAFQKKKNPNLRFAFTIQDPNNIPEELETTNINILPLSNEIIEDYIREFDNVDQLRSALQLEETFLESARNIFELQAMKTAYANTPKDKIIHNTKDTKFYSTQIIEHYIKKQLLASGNQYNYTNVLKWLGVLAAEAKSWGYLFGGTVPNGAISSSSSFWLTKKEQRSVKSATFLGVTGSSLFLSLSFLLVYDFLFNLHIFKDVYIFLILAGLLGGWMGVFIHDVLQHFLQGISEIVRKSPESIRVNFEKGYLEKQAGKFLNLQVNDYARVYGNDSSQVKQVQELFFRDGAERFIRGLFDGHSKALQAVMGKTGLIYGILLMSTWSIMSTYMFFLVPSLRYSSWKWVAGGVLVFVILPYVWNKIKKIIKSGHREVSYNNIPSPFNNFLVEIVNLIFNASIGFLIAIFISSLKIVFWYGALGMIPAMFMLARESLLWIKKSSIERDAEKSMSIFWFTWYFIRDMLSGFLFSLPGVLSFKLASWLDNKSDDLLSTYIRKQERIPLNTQDFLNTMQQCGFIRVYGDSCAFVHPSLQNFFEERQ